MAPAESGIEARGESSDDVVADGGFGADRSKKCGREDLNLHPRRDQDLNLARLPISPHPQCDVREGTPAAAGT